MGARVPLEVTRLIPAAPERVFGAFTSGDHLCQWFAPSPKVVVRVLTYQFRVGGEFLIEYAMPGGGHSQVGGDFKAITPARYIAMTWQWLAPDPLQGFSMSVEFSFLPEGAATKVVVVHRDIPSNVACSVQQDGWQGTLCRLEGLINEGVR